MKTLFFNSLILLTFIVVEAKSQNLIAMQNGGSPSFFTKLDSAVSHAQDGDTLYLPGGYYYLASNLDISKRLHIVGVGHNPDSSLATLQTRIRNGNVQLHTGASGGSFTGISLDGDLKFFDNVSNYIVQRCKLSFIYFFQTSAANNVIFQNVIYGISLSGGSQPTGFYNNIIDGYMSTCGGNTVFKNNIFLRGIVIFDMSFTGPVFENNVFLTYSPFEITFSGTYIVFNNNLFYWNVSFPTTLAGCDLVGSNNFVNLQQGSIFVNQSGNSFNYSHDYHLKPTCPGKNAGTDGTDIGIYGGSAPWKDGSIPANPHIQHKVIPNTTNQSGTLNVNIKVTAQDH